MKYTQYEQSTLVYVPLDILLTATLLPPKRQFPLSCFLTNVTTKHPISKIVNNVSHSRKWNLFKFEKVIFFGKIAQSKIWRGLFVNQKLSFPLSTSEPEIIFIAVNNP